MGENRTPTTSHKRKSAQTTGLRSHRPAGRPPLGPPTSRRPPARTPWPKPREGLRLFCLLSGGRRPGDARGVGLRSPLQGFMPLVRGKPRALPWATLVCPVGAQKTQALPWAGFRCPVGAQKTQALPWAGLRYPIGVEKTRALPCVDLMESPNGAWYYPGRCPACLGVPRWGSC